MEALGHGEVVAVVFSRGDSPQMLLGVASIRAFGANSRGSAHRQVTYGARAWLRATELCYSGS
jgi:hypothetical protein